MRFKKPSRKSRLKPKLNDKFYAEMKLDTDRVDRYEFLCGKRYLHSLNVYLYQLWIGLLPSKERLRYTH